MRPQTDSRRAERRAFMRRTAAVGAAGAVATAARAGETTPAAPTEVALPSGYRESDHVRAYYARARF